MAKWTNSFLVVISLTLLDSTDQMEKKQICMKNANERRNHGVHTETADKNGEKITIAQKMKSKHRNEYKIVWFYNWVSAAHTRLYALLSCKQTARQRRASTRKERERDNAREWERAETVKWIEREREQTLEWGYSEDICVTFFNIYGHLYSK